MVNESSKKRRRAATTENEAPKQYQVEAIMNKRVRGRKVEYLLKWKGYSQDENTVS